MKKRRVLITGGTGSVGQALVAAFAATYEVTFQFHTNTRTADQLSAQYRVEALKLDLRAQIAIPTPSFDVLINNAAINISSTLTHDVSLDDWNATLSVNLTAPFLLIKRCLPHMIAQRWGRIINISSIYALRGTDCNLPYSASKHGLSGLTRSVAKEYAERGITCNEICPGAIESELMLRIARREAPGAETDYLKAVSADIPDQRMARATEIADVVLFLASTAAAHINGASIPIDGGQIA